MVITTHIHLRNVGFLTAYLTMNHSIIINIQVTTTPLMNPIFRIELMLFSTHWARHYNLLHSISIYKDFCPSSKEFLC